MENELGQVSERVTDVDIAWKMYVGGVEVM